LKKYRKKPIWVPRYITPSKIIELIGKRVKLQPDDGTPTITVNISDIKKIPNTTNFDNIEIPISNNGKTKRKRSSEKATISNKKRKLAQKK